MKRIHIISPIKSIDHVRHEFCNVIVSQNIELEFTGLEKGIEGIATYFDRTIIAPEILRLAYIAEKGSASGIVINCFSEPALAAAKELLKVPVLGICEIVFAKIKQNKKKFALFLPEFHSNYLQMLKEKLKIYEVENYFTSFAQINTKTSLQNQKKLLEENIQNNLKLGAQAIILSSTYLASFKDYCQEKSSNVEVVLPLLDSINYMENILNGTQEYKKLLLYPSPEKVAQWISKVN